MIKYFSIIVVFLFSFFNVATANETASNPYDIMNTVADKVFSRLNAQQSQIQKNPEMLREVVHDDLLPYVQTKYAGALVLGRYYQQATPAQRSAYFAAFENYIVQAYAQALSLYYSQALDVYNGKRYHVEPAKNIGTRDIISIRVTLDNGNRAPVRLDFVWRKNKKTNDWKAYDMSVEGVSMITTKQNEWSSILRQKGIDALTKNLQTLAAAPITIEAAK